VDLGLIAVIGPLMIVVMAACAFAIFVTTGRPVLYRSKRRVFRDESQIIVKFRTMRRDAEKIANRDVLPVTDVRFLNINLDSPLYTRTGRWIEWLMLTETPQLYHVMRGEMTLVGNRPLPENVIKALREIYPSTEARFEAPCGLTGPVQLVGRSSISDKDRLWLETVYCRLAMHSYSPLLDLKILFWTIVVGLVPSRRFSPHQVFAMMLTGPNRGRLDVEWPQSLAPRKKAAD
jgi:lipopolysaccharide/colanic/teichoic acid biosynthesis glycosyltransferase